MPRLRSTLNGVVVNVSDERAKQLGADWRPVSKPQSEKSRKSEK